MSVLKIRGKNGEFHSVLTIRGDDGYTPVKGVDYSDGVDGKSAYEVAVEQGFVGTEAEWLTSLHGADGKDGKDGQNGADGKDGKDGQNGADGKDGVDGEKGDPGESGVYIGTDEPTEANVWIDPSGEPTSMVDDVQINGTSIVTDGVANIPKATNKTDGVIKVGYGLQTMSDGSVRTSPSDDAQLRGRTEAFAIISPYNFDRMLKYGMCDGKGDIWTAEEQAAARERIGLGKFELLEESVFEETVDYMSRNKDNQGNNYCLDAILIYLETNADESDGIGRCAVYSDDGYLCDFYLRILNNTKGSLTTIRTNAINGYWESIARNSIKDYDSTSSYANIMNKSIKPVIKTGYIRSFYISGKIVVGSKLTVYGVRA